MTETVSKVRVTLPHKLKAATQIKEMTFKSIKNIGNHINSQSLK